MAISSSMAISELKERNACAVETVFCCCCTGVMVVVDSSCCVKSFTKSRRIEGSAVSWQSDGKDPENCVDMCSISFLISFAVL